MGSRCALIKLLNKSNYSSQIEKNFKKMEEIENKSNLFQDLTNTNNCNSTKVIDDNEEIHQPTEVESLCVNCGENGVTTLLLAKIPHYREVILSSFHCEICGFRNNNIQSGGAIQDQGIQYKVNVRENEDLSRQVVRSEHATVMIPEIDLEIPPGTSGTVTTIEGILKRTVDGLMQDQPVRIHMDPEGAAQIEEYVNKIENQLMCLKSTFHLVIKDPSGNSYIENPHAPKPDPFTEVQQFKRSVEENHQLCIYEENETNAKLRNSEGIEVKREENSEKETPIDLENEVLTFATNCPDCNAPSSTNMKVTKIPFFKEVVIMATMCDACGHKTNEVKSGGGIEQTGTKITLKVTGSFDLSRDVLKSETASIEIPDIEFEMGSHAIGGRFTTLEGLLENVLEKIENNPMASFGALPGDSAKSETKEKMDEFKRKLKEMISGNKTFTFILDDPAGNSYLQNLYAPDDDPEMIIEKYERTFDQNEDLGLNDMKVENYGEQNL